MKRMFPEVVGCLALAMAWIKMRLAPRIFNQLDALLTRAVAHLMHDLLILHLAKCSMARRGMTPSGQALFRHNRQ
jgi:hypothetical protein